MQRVVIHTPEFYIKMTDLMKNKDAIVSRKKSQIHKNITNALKAKRLRQCGDIVVTLSPNPVQIMQANGIQSLATAVMGIVHGVNEDIQCETCEERLKCLTHTSGEMIADVKIQ